MTAKSKCASWVCGCALLVAFAATTASLVQAALAGAPADAEQGADSSAEGSTALLPGSDVTRTLDAPPVSPTALAASPDGRRLFIACATASRVAALDTASCRVVDWIEVPQCPLGLTLSKDGSRLYVACAAPSSTVCVIDVSGARPRIVRRMPAGHTSMSPVLSPDQKTLYVCNRFNDDVSAIDLDGNRVIRRFRVEREPVSADITPDGRHLVVANHLHAGTADHLHASAVVSIVDTVDGRVEKNIPLTFGATLLRQVTISPDGRFAAGAFVHARYWLSPKEIEMGRINCNALYVLDIQRLQLLGVLLLDQTARGAANPWAVAWTPDSRTIVASHAGTHEVSLIDAPVVADPLSFTSLRLGTYMGKDAVNIAGPPAHPVRVRQRVALPGNGPRALAVTGSTAYAANYFSDDLSRIDLTAPEPVAERIALARDRRSAGCSPCMANSGKSTALERRGEMLFNDARLCKQGWQSCASCHDADGRVDGFNWDLLNDGAGNPKNTKSLVWAHQTGAAMALGVRANASVAVRAGIHHILFSEQPEEVPLAIDAYLRSLRPSPSPYLKNGRLSPAAERGRRLFVSRETGCAACHPPGLLTDLAAYDVGTAREFGGLWEGKASDKPTDRFDTPTLTELWRTGPYLHDGSAATIRDVLTTRNQNDGHGRTSQLNPRQISDLAEYLLSL